MKERSGIAGVLRKMLTEPEEQLSRWERAARRSAMFCRHAARELMRDRAPQMAAALSYRTLFSLIPVLVVSLVVLQAFYGADSMEKPLGRMLEFMGVQDLSLNQSTPAEGAAGDITADTGGPVTVGGWIEQLVSQVQGLNFAAIGAVGLIVLLYAALSLIFEIERAFNVIYSAARSRKIFAKLVNYWTVLTLGPMGLLAGFYVNDRIGSLVETGAGGVAADMAGRILTFMISWLLLLLAYTVMPNTRVHLRPALAGSFAGAFLWEAGKWGFGKYLALSTGYSAYYGSLGLLPVFMLWVYVTWLVVLFGLELSYALQTMPTAKTSRELSSRRATGTLDPAAGVALVMAVAKRFAKGDVVNESTLAGELGVESESVHAMVGGLIQNGILRAVDDGDAKTELAYTLARPADQIPIGKVLRIGLEMAGLGDDADNNVINRLRGAQLDAAGAMTIASVLPDTPNQPGGSA